MNISRPVFLLLLLIVTLLVIGEGMLTAPDEKWENVLVAESRGSGNEPIRLGADKENEERIRAQMQAQWDLAEHYLQRGDIDRAEEEYRRLKDEFPYSIDYGFRHDDADKRLREISRMRAVKDGGSFKPPGSIAAEL